MGLNLSRDLLRSASRIAIAAAAAAALAGCGGTTPLATGDNAERAATTLETAAPDTQDFVGGAAYWGAKYEANREDIGAALNFARNLRMMGGARQAVAVLKDVVMKAPDDARVLAEYGKALTAAGRAKDALPFLARSAQMKGDDWTTLSAYGVALDQTGSHANAREMYQALEHPTLGTLAEVGAPGFPLKFGAAATGYDSPAPLPRQHNHEIYSGLLGLDSAELARLDAAGVI